MLNVNTTPNRAVGLDDDDEKKRQQQQATQPAQQTNTTPVQQPRQTTQPVDTVSSAAPTPIRSVPPVQATEPVTPQRTVTAQQRLQSQPTPSSEPNKWYKGDAPTANEIKGQIYTMVERGQTEIAKETWDQMMQFQADPTSPIYNPYATSATNKAVSALTEMGYDMSDPAKFLAENSDLMAFYSTGKNSHTPTQPGKRASQEEWAAYWYYNVAKDQETTEKADLEWQALQEDVRYWVNRSDRNYSDDEIKARIDWKKYPTLSKMQDSLATGTPIDLNTANGFSMDAIDGVIWDARNPDSGVAEAQWGAMYAMGKGNMYKPDPDTSAKLDPTSEKYAPYTVGGTADDVLSYFGVDSIDENWINENRYRLNSSDATEVDMYQKALKAYDFTSKVQADVQAFMEGVDSMLEAVSDPEAVMAYMLDSDLYTSSMKKLSDSERYGDLVDTTSAIQFGKMELEQYIIDKCEAAKKAPQGDIFTASVVNDLGGNGNLLDSDTAISDVKSDRSETAWPTVNEYGTDAEKTVLQTGYGANYNTTVGNIATAVQTGTTNDQALYDKSIAAGNAAAVKSYLPARQTIDEYERVQANAAEGPARLQARMMELQASPDGQDHTMEFHKMQQEIEMNKVWLAEHKAEYDAAQADLRAIDNHFAAAAEAVGADTNGQPSILATLDFANAMGRFSPQDWYAFEDNLNAVADAGEDARAYAGTSRVNAVKQMQQIDTALAQMEAAGYDMGDDYVRGMQERRAQLARDVQATKWYELRYADDFDSVVEKAKADYASGALRAPIALGDSTYGRLHSSADPVVRDNAGLPGMRDEDDFLETFTDAERDTYLYLYATQGMDAANEYADSMTNEKYGAKTFRTKQMQEESWKAMTKSDSFIGTLALGALSTAATVLGSVNQVWGGLYTAGAAAGLYDYNPNSSLLDAGEMVGTVRSEVKQNITEATGDNLLGKIANLGYDIVTSMGDSWASGVTFGAINPVAGLEGSFWKEALSKFGGASAMGSYAFASGYQEAYLKTGDPTKALEMGAISFACETVTEAIELEDITKAMRNGAAGEAVSAVKGALQSMASEAFGEGASEALESLGDTLIMGELSNRSEAINNYIELGMTPDEAKHQADIDILSNVMYAALAGAGSAAGNAVIGHALGRDAQQNSTEANVENTEVNTAISTQATVENAVPADPANRPTVNPDAANPAIRASVRDSRFKNATMALEDAMTTTDTSAISSTIAGVLVSDTGNTTQSIAASNAAAMSVVKELGDKAAPVIQSILLTAKQGVTEMGDLQGALIQSALSNGQSHEILQQIASEGGATEESLNALMTAATEEIQQPGNQEKINATVHEFRVAQEVNRLIQEEGGMDSVVALENDFHSKMEAYNNAESALTYMQRSYEATVANLQSATEEYQQNPSNQRMQGIVLQLTKDVAGAQAVVDEYTQSRNNAEEAVNEAKKNLGTARADKMAELRQQAQDNVAAQYETEAQQIVEAQQAQAVAAEQARVAQEDANTRSINADNFVARYYADYDEATQAQVREAYMNYQGENKDTTLSNLRFAAGISRKFGTKVSFTNSHGLFNGVRLASGEIVLDRTATQGDAIKAVAVHELTHAAEASDWYNDLKSAVMSMVYDGDQAKYEEAVNTKFDAYSRALGDDFTREDAEHEVVADMVGELLSQKGGEYAARLAGEQPGLARRILEAIRDIVNKIRGVQGTEADQLRNLEKTLEKAINDAQQKEGTFNSAEHPAANQFSISQLAESLNLKLRQNSDGVPYELIDRNGNVVKEITAEQIVDTPMGKMLTSSVKAGNIDDSTAGKLMEMYAGIATMCAQYKDQAMIWELAGAELYSAIKNNSDKQYSTTVDFGTICSKTQAIIDTLSDTMVRLGRGLTRAEVIAAYQGTAEADLSVPCPVCYVFSRWMGVPSLLNNMKRYQDRFGGMSREELTSYIRSVQERYAPKKANESFAKSLGKKKTSLEKRLETTNKNIQKRVDELNAQLQELGTEMQNALAEDMNGQNNDKKLTQLREKAEILEKEYADVEAYNWVTQVMCQRESVGKTMELVFDEDGLVQLNPDYHAVDPGILFDLRRTGEFAEKYPASWKYRTTRGAGMGKAILPYSGATVGDTVYSQQRRKAASDNAFLNMTEDVGALTRAKARAMKQNLIGGQRFQSTSDFRPEWGLDYLQTMIEMQAIGSKGQLYTKVIEAVDMFASAGIEVNMSIMAKGNGYHVDADGKNVIGVEDFSNITGIDFEQALKMTEKYDNAQLILVGMNDEHIRLALADSRISFVIPWHSSGNSGDVLKTLVAANKDNLQESSDYTDIQSDKKKTKQTEAQKQAWNTRMRIITGALEGGMTEADQQAISSSKYLQSLYNRMYVDESATETYHVFLAEEQAKQVFPYEYWDTSLNLEDADQNGRNFVEYCAEIGLTPRFEKFKNLPGYWKLLIDRRMYNRDGTYHHPSVIDATNVDIGDVARSVGTAKYGEAYKSEANQAILNTLDKIQAMAPADTEHVSDVHEQLVQEMQADQQETQRQEATRRAQFSLPTNTTMQETLAADRFDMEQEEQRLMGDRQFATQTAQRSTNMPEDLKQELLSNMDQSKYAKDTNAAQLDRAWERIQSNGYVATRDELFSKDNYNADDVAAANIIMEMAFRDGDFETAMDISHAYNKMGTVQAQGLQARRIFDKMTPAMARNWVAGKCEQELQQSLEKTPSKKTQMEADTAEITEQIRDLDATDKLAELNAQEEFEVSTDSKWGVPINERQAALIKQYKLENVKLPGVFYNRATVKQRMLMTILDTADPLKQTGGGFNLVDRLNLMRMGETVITPTDLDYITGQIRLAEVLRKVDGDTRGNDLALARASEAMANVKQLQLKDKYRAWRYTAMLMSGPSAMRNIVGNGVFQGINYVADSLATGIDTLVGKATGERTRTFTDAKTKIEGWKAFIDETQNTFHDYFTEKADASPKNDKYNLSMNRQGRVFQNNLLETMRNIEGFLMSLGDRNTWKMAYLNAFAEQQKLAQLNQTEFDSDAAIQKAIDAASYAIFDEDGPVRDGMSALKRIPGLGKVVDFAMPFTGVPTNIVKRMWQFSPLGLASTLLNEGRRQLMSMSKMGANAINMQTGNDALSNLLYNVTTTDFNQEQFVNGFARGLTGSMLFLAGMALHSMGAIKLGYGADDDKKRSGVESAMGDQYSPYITIGDQNIALSVFNPSAAALVMGATMSKELENDEPLWQAIYNGAIAAGSQIFDESYLTGLQDLFSNTYSDNVIENAMLTTASSAVSQTVPTILSQLATAIDPYVRDTKDKDVIQKILKTGLIQKIPGLRETLPEKVNVAGESVRSKEGIWNFIDPFNRTDVNDDPALKELMRLSDELGETNFLPEDALSGAKNSFTVDKETYVLSDDQKEAYKKRYGDLWLNGGTTTNRKGATVSVEGVRSLMNSPAYQVMSDEEKAEAISSIVSKAKTGAMMEAVSGVEGYESKALIDNLNPVFQADDGKEYMSMAREAFELSGSDSVLPNPTGEFTSGGVKVKLEGEKLNAYTKAYHDTYANGVINLKVSWAKMTAEEKAKALSSVKTKAHNAGKKAAGY